MIDTSVIRNNWPVISALRVDALCIVFVIFRLLNPRSQSAVEAGIAKTRSEKMKKRKSLDKWLVKLNFELALYKYMYV